MWSVRWQAFLRCRRENVADSGRLSSVGDCGRWTRQWPLYSFHCPISCSNQSNQSKILGRWVPSIALYPFDLFAWLTLLQKHRDIKGYNQYLLHHSKQSKASHVWFWGDRPFFDQSDQSKEYQTWDEPFFHWPLYLSWSCCLIYLWEGVQRYQLLYKWTKNARRDIELYRIYYGIKNL